MQVADREKIELFVSGRNLRDKDILSKSDPYFVLLYKEKKDDIYKKIGQSEVQENNLNPNFKKSIETDYIFERQQYVQLEIWDKDKGDDDDMIGFAEFTVGQLMGSKDQILRLALSNKKHNKFCGHAYVKADRVKQNQGMVRWQWRGHKLLNTDGWFDKSDPFLRFFRKAGDDWVLAHESEFLPDTLEPIWEPFDIPCYKLDNGNAAAPIKIECWDNSKKGPAHHHFIGAVETSMNEILANKRTEFKMNNPKEKKCGILYLQQVNYYIKPTFIDYLQGGDQISMVVAIDFTGSNGDPRSPQSLHSIVPGVLNQYEAALFQVSSILLNYDFDKQIPVFGFGGQPNLPNYKKSEADHCFPLNGNPARPEVPGLEGIMDVYHQALQCVALSGPTYFGQVLQNSLQIARENNINNYVYTVLLILTDGEIHDMEKTQSLIQQCALLPISIIIIGVGNEQFHQMKKLDGDDEVEQKQKKGQKIVRRDLVQFVAYKQYAHDPALLAAEVLKELPGQFLEFKRLVNQQPRAFQQVTLSGLN